MTRDPAAVLAAALPVLEAVEAYVEQVEGPRVFVDWHLYRDMRDAFYAFRASVEAGAPLGWAVAEEPAEVGGMNAADHHLFVADLQAEVNYWRARCEKAEMETRVAMRKAMLTEQDNDSLRVTLAATRAELDRGLTLAVEERRRMTELERALEIYEHDTDYRSAEQGCS